MPKNINYQERIDLNAIIDPNFAVKMAEGNPGAVTVIVQLIDDKSDPDSWAGGIGNLLSLDTHGIYGSNIWVMFKNCCNQNILNVVTVLRAVQLGLYTERELWQCIDTCTPIDCNQLLVKVRKELPRFGNVESQPA